MELNKVRQGRDISCYVQVAVNGMLLDWSSVEIASVRMRSDVQPMVTGQCAYKVKSDEPTKLLVTYDHSQPQYLGQNSIIVTYRMNEVDVTANVPVVIFVASTEEESYGDNPQILIELVDTEASIKGAEELRVKAESARVVSEASRVEAENTRVTAETSREEAEAARVTAEQIRADKETERKNAETGRKTAETNRKNAETAREEAEDLRKAAESVREASEEVRIASEDSRNDAEGAREMAERSRSNEYQELKARLVDDINTAETLISEATEAKTDTIAATASAIQATDSANAAAQAANTATAQATAASESATAAAGSANEAATAANQAAAGIEGELGTLSTRVAESIKAVVSLPKDDSQLPTLCGQPSILFGEGTPQEAIVPINWKGLKDGGYAWTGLPSAIGQQYININVTTNGRYIAVRNGVHELKWLNF